MKKAGILIAILASFAAGVLITNRADAQLNVPKDLSVHFFQARFTLHHFESRTFNIPRLDAPVRIEILTSQVMVINGSDCDPSPCPTFTAQPRLTSLLIAKDTSTGILLGGNEHSLQLSGFDQAAGIKLKINPNNTMRIEVLPGQSLLSPSVDFCINMWF